MRFSNPYIRNRTAILILIFSVLTILVIILLWPGECLTAETGGRMLFAKPIRKGESFEVRFTHSLNLSPVTDVFEWTGNEMILRKSRFKTFGAGIPVPSDGIGTELVHVDGHYELLGIDKPLQSFSIMTQEIPDHQIIFKNCEISLLKLAGSGHSVAIRVKRVPWLVRMLISGGA